MKIEIYVPDEYKKKYDEAIAKLKADKYDDIPEKEKDALMLDIARIVALEKFKQKMEEIIECEDPYNYFNDYGAFYNEVENVIK